MQIAAFKKIEENNSAIKNISSLEKIQFFLTLKINEDLYKQSVLDKLARTIYDTFASSRH